MDATAVVPEAALVAALTAPVVAQNVLAPKGAEFEARVRAASLRNRRRLDAIIRAWREYDHLTAQLGAVDPAALLLRGDGAGVGTDHGWAAGNSWPPSRCAETSFTLLGVG